MCEEYFIEPFNNVNRLFQTHFLFFFKLFRSNWFSVYYYHNSIYRWTVISYHFFIMFNDSIIFDEFKLNDFFLIGN